MEEQFQGEVRVTKTMSIPKDWTIAKQSPKWRTTMLEELNALAKNITKEFIPFSTLLAVSA